MLNEQPLNQPSSQPVPRPDQLSKDERKSVFEAIPSKTSFFAGLVAGVMSFSTLGFIFVMVGMMDLSDLKLTGKNNVWGAKPAAAVNANANANVPAAPEQGSGIDLSQLPQPTADEHVRGDLNTAKFVLIEYSDYECPFCKKFDATMQEVFKAYGSDVAWIYRHFPLSFHENAQKEAEASECAAELGGNDAFWKYSDALYARTTSNGTGFALDKLGPLAKEIGLSQTKFQSCLDSGKYAQKVNDQLAGGSAAGVSGTPGTIILTLDGKSDLIEGALPIDTVKKQIDALLQ